MLLLRFPSSPKSFLLPFPVESLPRHPFDLSCSSSRGLGVDLGVLRASWARLGQDVVLAWSGCRVSLVRLGQDVARPVSGRASWARLGKSACFSQVAPLISPISSDSLLITRVIAHSCPQVAQRARNPEFEDLYDVVIMDICDPMEGFSAARTYTREFYTMCKQIMRPDGIFVTQATALQTTNYVTAARIRKTAEEVWGSALLYKSFMPSFVDCWGREGF